MIIWILIICLTIRWKTFVWMPPIVLRCLKAKVFRETPLYRLTENWIIEDVTWLSVESLDMVIMITISIHSLKHVITNCWIIWEVTLSYIVINILQLLHATITIRPKWLIANPLPRPLSCSSVISFSINIARVTRPRSICSIIRTGLSAELSLPGMSLMQWTAWARMLNIVIITMTLQWGCVSFVRSISWMWACLSNHRTLPCLIKKETIWLIQHILYSTSHRIWTCVSVSQK